MTYRYCSPEEENEIRALYRTGEYSYKQIGEMKSLSKSTVINIVLHYPYNRDKQAYFARLQIESAERLEQEIIAVKQRAQKAHDRGNIPAYGMHTRQWLMLLDLLPDKDRLYERLKEERTACEQKAWEGFGDADYNSFGYHADTWVMLTDILGDNAKNPWGEIAKLCKGKSRSVKFANIDRKEQNINFTAIVAKSNDIVLSDEFWRYISPLVPEKGSGRPSDHRQIMEGIIYALINCRSFRTVPKRYGDRYPLTTHFAEWYRDDVFTDLLMFLPAFPELDPARGALLQIQKHRLLYGDSVPRLCDIRRGVECEKGKNCT